MIPALQGATVAVFCSAQPCPRRADGDLFDDNNRAWPICEPHVIEFQALCERMSPMDALLRVLTGATDAGVRSGT